MKVDKVREVMRILDFLGVRYDKAEVESRMAEDYATFKRKPLVNEFDHFTDSQKKIINDCISDAIEYTKQYSIELGLNLDEYFQNR